MEKHILVNNEEEYNDLIKKLYQDGYSWSSGKKINKIDFKDMYKPAVLYIYDDTKKAEYSSFDYYKLRYNNDIISAKDFLNGKKMTKIRRPDIDPFDEEDWGFVQESVDCDEIKSKGVMFNSREEMIEVGKILIEMGFELFNEKSVMNGDYYNESDNYVPWKRFYYNGSRFVRYSSSFSLISIQPLTIDEIKNPKKRIKVRRPDIDPFDEEDWGYVQESQTFRHNMFIETRRVKVDNSKEFYDILSELDIHGYSMISGRDLKDVKYIDPLSKPVILVLDDDNKRIKFGVLECNPNFINVRDFRVDSSKKRTKIRRPDIDPFDEEDWGFEDINENYDINQGNRVDMIEFGKKYGEDAIILLNQYFVNKRVVFEGSEGQLYDNNGNFYVTQEYDWDNDNIEVRMNYGDKGIPYALIFFDSVPDAENLKKLKKIIRPDIDPHNEEDWGYEEMNESININDGVRVDFINLISDYGIDKAIEILNKDFVNKIVVFEGQNGELYYNYYNNKGFFKTKEFKKYGDEGGIRVTMMDGQNGNPDALIFFDKIPELNYNKRTKIRRPDIDPFDEEDWGYVQEKLKYGHVGQLYDVGDYIVISPKLENYIEKYHHWNFMRKMIGKTYQVIAISELRMINEYTYQIFVDGVNVYIPFDCVEGGKKRTKIRRPDIDPFDEEDWGYVQESLTVNDFKVGDIVELSDSRKKELLKHLHAGLNNKLDKWIRGEVIEIYDDRGLEPPGEYSIEVDWGAERGNRIFAIHKPSSLKLIGKKRVKIRRPDIDPFDEEDWGYENINENFDRKKPRLRYVRYSYNADENFKQKIKNF